MFITKPVVYIKYDDVVAVEFSRAESWVTQTRFFDLKVYKKGENQPYDFQQIDRNEYQPLIDFLQSAGIKIRNLEKGGSSGAGGAKETEPEQTLLGEDFDDEDEDSEYVSEDEGDEDSEGDDDDESDEGDESDSEDRKRKKQKRTEDEERKEIKHKKDKKEKKHKKDKKEKKHKSSRD